MKSILCFELKRCFGSKRLYLSLLTGIVISLLHIIFGVLPLTQWLSSWQGDFFLTPHSAYGHWIGMDSSTVWPTLLYMLLPFLCAFPFSDTVSWDFNTGYVMQIFVRRKKSTYLFAKALTIFIASAFLTATILFFDFAGTALYLPLVRPEALTNLYGISNRSLMAHLFYHESGIKEIRDLLRELRQKGKLIVLTCHDRQQMESLADEIIAMREGRIVNVDKNCHEEV